MHKIVIYDIVLLIFATAKRWLRLHLSPSQMDVVRLTKDKPNFTPQGNKKSVPPKTEKPKEPTKKIQKPKDHHDTLKGNNGYR